MQSKRSTLNTLSSNPVKQEKEEMFLVSLPFLYLTLKLFLKRADFFSFKNELCDDYLKEFKEKHEDNSIKAFKNPVCNLSLF